MAKKAKTKKGSSLDILDLGAPQQIQIAPLDEEDKEVKSRKSILEERFKNRKIPKVDDGIKNNDLSTDALQRFYREARVSEFVKPEGGNKYIRFEFGKMLDGYRVNTDDRGENDTIRKLTYAELTKKSFINNINLTVRYINYFIEYFDDDDELMSAYFQLMLQIHFTKLHMTVENFVDAVFASIATESMVEKVIRMVEYNVDKNMIKKSERSYDESIQLTVEHLKAIMGVSCFHKFAIPIVSHFYTVRRKELEEEGWNDKDLYYYVFSSFIPLFDEYYDISLYGKLYHTATTRISKTENQENTMWKRRNRFGTTPTSFTNDLMRDFLNDISQKCVFNMSAIVFIHVCFDKAIKNELIQPDKHEMSDIKMDASDSVNETISRWDRWQMDKTLHSERDRLRAYVSIKDSLMRLGQEVDLPFNLLESTNPKHQSMAKEIREEYEYYQNNIQQPLNDTQMYIIELYYASKLHCAEDVKMLEIPDLIKLIMIMKRDFASRNYNYLQFFISSKVDPTAGRKYNKKKVEKLFMQHPSYQDLMDEYEDTLKLMNMDKILGHLKTLISCPIRVVDYDYEQYRGQKMTPVELCVCDEFVRLLCEL